MQCTGSQVPTGGSFIRAFNSLWGDSSGYLPACSPGEAVPCGSSKEE